VDVCGFFLFFFAKGVPDNFPQRDRGSRRRQVREREGRGGAAGGDAEKMGEEERLLSPARRK
jgi:hypothetical protein